MTRPYLKSEIILLAALRVTGVDAGDLCSRHKHPEIVSARAAIVEVARRRTLMSYPEITRSMLGRSRKSHSTAVSAHARYQRDIERLRPVADAIEAKAEELGTVGCHLGSAI